MLAHKTALREVEGTFRDRHRALGVDDRCQILGYRAEVLRVFAACEGFPIALMEAMDMGLPEVATDVGGIPDAVTHGRGFLTRPADPSAVAASMLAMCRDDSGRQEMAALAQDRGRTFDARTAVQSVEAAYVDVADLFGVR